MSYFTLNIIINLLFTTCKPFIKAPGCLFTLNVVIFNVQGVFEG